MKLAMIRGGAKALWKRPVVSSASDSAPARGLRCRTTAAVSTAVPSVPWAPVGQSSTGSQSTGTRDECRSVPSFKHTSKRRGATQGFCVLGGALLGGALCGGPTRCDEAPAESAPNASAARRQARPTTAFARCEVSTLQLSDASIITVDVAKDRPGLLNEATEFMNRNSLNIRDAQVTTLEDDRARHVYTVQDRATGRGLSQEQLEKIQSMLQSLGNVEVEAKAWPKYTRAEVAKHTSIETGIWVSFKDKVYDITEFVANHPGGKDKIMLAAGKAIDPFWRIYQQHEGRGTASKQLASMQIGDLADPPVAVVGDDPYSKDPDRHPGLILHNNRPCNAELPGELMLDSWCTPNSVFFIRHHHPVPLVDSEKYRLEVGGDGAKRITLTLEDLRTRFLKREVVSTIQCGGNRRSELDQVEKTSGIPWGFGAMSTARWGGVYLREVLLHCAGLTVEGVQCTDGAKHVVLHGLDDMQASIPIEKALSPYGDVLLAYEMNGEPLCAEHGSPVRLVVPGVVGVRNVKWVGRIEISREEAQGPWQRGIAYKGFSPSVKDFKDVDVEKILSIQEMPVQSSIVFPKAGATTELDDIEVKGFAWSGGGRGIVRVDVSIDGGQNWTTAELGEGADQHPTRAWAWTFWEASMPVPEDLRGKEITVTCRATDSSYNTQPERPEPIWNLRGLNCNCWHRVTIRHLDE